MTPQLKHYVALTLEYSSSVALAPKKFETPSLEQLLYVNPKSRQLLNETGLT